MEIQNRRCCPRVPALADGELFIGSWDSYFYALDARTGRELWRFKTGADPEIHNQVGIQSSAAVANGIVYFGCRDSNFYALDAATGKERWRFNNKGSWVIGSPAVRDDKVYFATSDTALLYAFDAKTGTQIFSLSFKGWPLFSSPAIAADRLYVGSHEGKLFAVDLQSQKLAWTFATDGSKKNGPTYTKPDGTTNYELAFTDFFYDDMVSGVQKLATVGAVLSSPVVAGDSVYFGSTDGNVYALISKSKGPRFWFPRRPRRSSTPRRCSIGRRHRLQTSWGRTQLHAALLRPSPIES
jgi:outer membrane protein assembly factor BamB